MVTNSIEPETLGQRIAKLEDRFDEDKRSLSKRFSVWGGLVALVFSILIGGFQVYDFTVLRKVEAREESKLILGDYIRRISELNTMIFTNSVSADTPKKFTESIQRERIINSEKSSVVWSANRLLKEHPDAGGFAAYFTLAIENYFWLNDTAKALIFAQEALKKSTNNSEKIESKRIISMVQFAPGDSQDIESARKSFLDAIDNAKKAKFWNLVASTLSGLVISENNFGDCGKAKDALDDLKKSLDDVNMQFQLSTALIEINHILWGNENCPGLLNPGVRSHDQ